MGIQQVKNTPQAQESDTPMESKPLFKKMDPTLLLDHQPQQQLMPEPQEDTPNKLDQKQQQEHSTNITQQEHTKALEQEKPQLQEIFAKEEKTKPLLLHTLKVKLVFADTITQEWMMVPDALKEEDMMITMKWKEDMKKMRWKVDMKKMRWNNLELVADSIQ